VPRRKPETTIKQAVVEAVVLSDKLRKLQQDAQALGIEIGRVVSDLDRVINRMEAP
jgi:hypothetical protein